MFIVSHKYKLSIIINIFYEHISMNLNIYMDLLTQILINFNDKDIFDNFFYLYHVILFLLNFISSFVHLFINLENY